MNFHYNYIYELTAWCTIIFIIINSFSQAVRMCAYVRITLPSTGVVFHMKKKLYPRTRIRYSLVLFFLI